MLCCIFKQLYFFQISLPLIDPIRRIVSCDFQAAVSQYIRQIQKILCHFIKGSCKQMPQVVGKDLAGFHSRLCTQSLHFRPDLPAGETGPVSDEKDLTGNGFVVALAKEIHQLCW